MPTGIASFNSQGTGKESPSREVKADTLRSYGQRLTNIDSLASRGVHGEVLRGGAERCVMWTFMLTADLLRILDATSLDLAANTSEATIP
jgi:hypothetical protein